VEFSLLIIRRRKFLRSREKGRSKESVSCQEIKEVSQGKSLTKATRSADVTSLPVDEGGGRGVGERHRSPWLISFS